MRTKVGTVTSNAMQRTIVVQVDTYKRHPKYLKKYCISKKFYVHTADETQYAVGDTVEIKETRPLSKLKRWVVLREAEALNL